MSLPRSESAVRTDPIQKGSSTSSAPVDILGEVASFPFETASLDGEDRRRLQRVIVDRLALSGRHLRWF